MAEAKRKQREFFKDYSTLYPVLEKIFYYGTYSAKDLADENICKKSKYNDIQKTLEYVLGDLLESKKNSKGQKALKISKDHFDETRRSFMRLFALKSFTSTERLLRTLFILQLLNAGEPLSAKEIADAFNDDVEELYVRRIADELCDVGILHKSDRNNEKKAQLYSIGYDLNTLSAAQREKLLDYIDLCTAVYPLSICGSGIRNKLDSWYQSPFLFKHLCLGFTFNDEKIWKLIVYIHQKQHVRITRDNGELRDVLPYRIITNKTTGRQYVFTVYVGKEEFDEYLLVRIDGIKEIRPETSECTIPDDDVLKEKYKTAFRYSFNGSTIIQRNEEPQTGVLEYKNNDEWLVKRHFPDAEPEVVDSEHKRVTVTVNSFTELKPWLRRNMTKIRLIECTDNTVVELQSEMKQWREMYGLE